MVNGGKKGGVVNTSAWTSIFERLFIPLYVSVCTARQGPLRGNQHSSYNGRENYQLWFIEMILSFLSLIGDVVPGKRGVELQTRGFGASTSLQVGL